MDFKTRVRIFLTKYMELVKETGMAIGENIYDKGESSLLIRIRPDIKSLYDECPSYLPLYGDDPELESFFAIMYTDENKMVQLDPYEELPTYDTGYKIKSQEEINDELRALGLIK